MRKAAYSARRQRRQRNAPVVFLLTVSIIILVISFFIFLQNLSADIAVSDASDIVAVNVNRAIAEIMSEGDYAGDYFVTFLRSESGEVTAVSSNMARINELSAKVLQRVIGATGRNTISVKIPAGNLTGISLLMGLGPRIPLEIDMLTTSTVDFTNSIVTAGINQSKHQISLIVNVDVDIIIPWCKRSTNVITEVLIADTVIVGRVPETYLNMK